jgi:DNA-binding GntR family transcriptional regulator
MKVSRMGIREQTVEALRGAIVSGELAPGQRLIERELCEELDVARNTLREAYRQLEAEGLIEITPHKGPTVTLMSDDQARQVYEVREALESYAVRQFTERASDSELAVLKEASVRLSHAITDGTPRDLVETKNGFYDVLFDGAQNEFLHDQARLMYSRLASLRIRSLSYPGRARESSDELNEIVAAIEARDSVLAESLWRRHVRNAASAAFKVSATPPAATLASLLD